MRPPMQVASNVNWKLTVRVLAFLIAALSATGANAQTTFYGITFGQPLAVPECQVQKIGNMSSYVISAPFLCYRQGGLAFLDVKHGASIANSDVTLHWPSTQGPSMAKAGVLRVRLVDGVVHGVSMGTHGHLNQQQVFSELVGKFGQPVNVHSLPLQNLFGVKVEGIVARWQDGDVSVTFDGILDKIDHGRVVLETPTGAAAAKAEHDQIMNTPAKPKM